MEDPFENRQQQNVLQDFSIRHEDESGGKPSKSLSSSVKTALWIMKILVLVVTTTCLVFNKLTIIERFSVVYQHVNVNASFNRSQSDSPSSSTSIIQVLQVYWQLLFIVMIPNCILWLYSIFKGIFSQSWSHPWPSTSAVLFGIFIAGLEAIAETVLYFVVFVSFPPIIVIFLMSGLFSIQGLLNIYVLNTARLNNYSPNYQPIGRTPIYAQMKLSVKIVLTFLTVVGIVCQIGGLVTITGLASRHGILPIAGIMLVCLLVLAFSWTNTIQKLTFRPSKKDIERAKRRGKSEMRAVCGGRWKACFIATTTRLLLYPIVSYCIVRFFYQMKDSNSAVDPWCIKSDYSVCIKKVFSWDAHGSAVFGVHVVLSFVANAFQAVACYMTLHLFGLALPLFLTTPLSVGIYILPNLTHVQFFPFSHNYSTTLDITDSFTKISLTLAIVVWLGQYLIAAFNLVKSKNAILAFNEEMFVRPYYNSVVMEQYSAINRCVVKSHFNLNKNRPPANIFICSTMYRENSTEMQQLLQSIYRVAQYYNKRKYEDGDKFESHIFFDGGCSGEELSRFAIQLMSLVSEALKVEINEGVKIKTPYGYRFRWNIEKCMPFIIHFKDNQKIKNKKRWSQVMYMNYIIKFRPELEALDLANTFILTTDADIKFEAEAAVALLDMLARDDQVGGVCARTYPLGSGLMYWYQVFDYAIGHWLQKGGEHILGSVLCCPGCFSMFRCSALKDCYQIYSSEVENAIEFLTKDMGEDRWLCTLLVEKGWRLEYCAISENHTYCPIEFDEFFKQRRRWIPSTIANLWLLVSEGRKMTAGNDSIGWLFISYQVLIIIATVLAPATIILIIASGLNTFGLSNIGVIVTFLTLTVIYGLVCVYTSQQTQLDVAKLLSFLFSVIMTVVVTGIIKEVLKEVLPSPSSNSSSVELLIDADQSHTILKIPVGETTIYVGLFAFIFTVTAFCHFKEFFTVFHCLWYLLGLPSGYLLLLIYSAANLNSRSWGTREKSDATGMLTLMQKNLKLLLLRFSKVFQKKDPKEDPKALVDNEPKPPPVEEKPQDGWQGHVYDESPTRGGGGLEDPSYLSQPSPSYRHHKFLLNWLKNCGCEKFYDLFAKEGFTEEKYLSVMTEQDLRDIGIDKDGYNRHLMKAIKNLGTSKSYIHPGIPKDVASWINNDLGMGSEEDNYVEKFFNNGYFGEDDVVNLQLITKDELMNVIEVRKKAHVKRFLQGIQNLKYCSTDEERIIKAESILLNESQPQEDLGSHEVAFWLELLETVLHPVPESLAQTSGLKDELRYLRNSALISFLLINLIWIILISLLTVDELNSALGLSNKFLSLVFLLVYGFIVVVQFFAMLFHRTVTLAHYISRVNQSLPVVQTQEFVFTQTQAF